MPDKPDMEPEASERAPLTGGQASGRRVAQLIYYAAAAVFATAVTVQVTQQVFFAESPDRQPAPFDSCRDGLQMLYQAVERGRQAAEKAGPDEDEEAALRRYRDTVRASWRHRDAVARLCQSAPTERALLDALERLRYSEEHGVRHQAAELTALRQRVRKLMAQSPPAAAGDETRGHESPRAPQETP